MGAATAAAAPASPRASASGGAEPVALPPPYESDLHFATVRPRHVFGWITGSDVSPTVWMGPPASGLGHRGFGAVLVIPTLETLAPYRTVELFAAWTTALRACFSEEDGGVGVVHPTREVMCTPSLVALASMRPDLYVWLHEGAVAWSGYTLLAPPAAYDTGDPPKSVSATIDGAYFPIVGVSAPDARVPLPAYADLVAAFDLPVPPAPPAVDAFEAVTPARVKAASHGLHAAAAAAVAASDGQNMNTPARSLAEFYTRVLAATHPRLVAPSPLHAFCDSFGLNQVLCLEYVDALAAYLRDRLAAYGGGALAEVGAGLGVLATALRERGLPIVASSTREKWPRPFLSAQALVPRGVAEEDQAATVARVAPTVVLCAWMPPGADWAAEWRQAGSVREYVLIGPVPCPVSCPPAGLPGMWGFSPAEVGEPLSYAPLGTPADDAGALPEGWAAHDVPDVARWSICRSDGVLPFSKSTVRAVRRL